MLDEKYYNILKRKFDTLIEEDINSNIDVIPMLYILSHFKPDKLFLPQKKIKFNGINLSV